MTLTLAKATATIPRFHYVPPDPSKTYQLLLVDLSISEKGVNTSMLNPKVQLPLATGIAAGRTTRLHFWQTGLTFTASGAVVNHTDPIAFYQGPLPPAGDIAHTYVFYLFEQGDAFRPPPPGNPFSAALINEGTNRMSFSVAHLAGENGVGPLVAANYIEVQNQQQASSSSSPSATASSGPSASASASKPTGAGTVGSASPIPSPFLGGAGPTRGGGAAGFIGLAATICAIATAAMAWAWSA